jgi:hypothetical protein
MRTPAGGHAQFDAESTRAAVGRWAGGCGWAIRNAVGTDLTCELRDRGPWGVEVRICRDDRYLYSQRWPDRRAAVLASNDLKTAYLLGGGILLAESDS